MHRLEKKSLTQSHLYPGYFRCLIHAQKIVSEIWHFRSCGYFSLASRKPYFDIAYDFLNPTVLPTQLLRSIVINFT